MLRLPESVIYKALLETSSDHILTKLFQTAVEVTEILYASADRSTPATYLVYTTSHSFMVCSAEICLQNQINDKA